MEEIRRKLINVISFGVNTPISNQRRRQLDCKSYPTDAKEEVIEMLAEGVEICELINGAS